MKKTVKHLITSIAPMVMLLLGSSVIAVAAETRDAEWYISPSISYIIADDDRLADNDLGLQIGVGRILNSRWNMEISGVFDNLDFEAGSGQYQQRGALVDGLYMFYRQPELQPFALIGLGALRTKALGESNVNALFNIGVGVMHALSGSNISFRADIRHRWDFDDKTISTENRFNDWMVSFGIAIPFGGSGEPMETKTPVTIQEKLRDGDYDGIPDSKDECPSSGPDAIVDDKGCDLDSDNDGVADSQDKCSGTPAGVNVDDTGCELDDDKDRVVNRLDKCPDSAPKATVDARGCELDTDNDGVVDSKDQCADTRQGAAVGANGCELDRDGDGVSDADDKCLNTAAGVKVDIHGCELKQTIILKGVNFVTGSAELTPEAMTVLDDVAATLMKNADIKVEIAGYTDNTGNANFNLKLSQRRAESVKRYLSSASVSAGRMSARGYGITNPIADNATREGRAENRRVEMHIIE